MQICCDVDISLPQVIIPEFLKSFEFESLDVPVFVVLDFGRFEVKQQRDWLQTKVDTNICNFDHSRYNAHLISFTGIQISAISGEEFVKFVKGMQWADTCDVLDISSFNVLVAYCPTVPYNDNPFLIIRADFASFSVNLTSEVYNRIVSVVHSVSIALQPFRASTISNKVESLAIKNYDWQLVDLLYDREDPLPKLLEASNITIFNLEAN